MASTNEEVAALLREYAELLGLTGGDPFRARNYERAAKAVAGYPGDLGALPDSALTTIPGVGTSIAGKIAEYRRTGDVRGAGRSCAPRFRPACCSSPQVPGVGPKRALQLVRELGITSARRARRGGQRAGRLREVSGFGAEDRGAHPARHRRDGRRRRAARRAAVAAGRRERGRHLRGARRPPAGRHGRSPGERRQPGRGGGAGEPARSDRGPPRRPAHAHRPHRRHRLAGGR